jgi:AcrR family transcriptional regulator
MRLFLEHGFDNVSIVKIAAAADVSVQTVYNYFPAKADLVFDEADQICGDLRAAVRHRLPGQSALSAIRGYFAATTRATRRTRPRLPRTRPRRLRRLARPSTCPAEQERRTCAHHGGTVTRQRAARR